MEAHIRVCLENDIDTLLQIGYETYNETFRPMNTAETMDKYLAEAFNRNKIMSELKNRDSKFYYLFSDDKLAGYMKINDATAQTDIMDSDSLEVERIYVRNSFKGNGLGKILMDYSIKLGNDMHKKYIWLGVWEKNIAAIAFCKKMGFSEWKRHSFRMGNELQSNIIMKKDLKRD